MSTSDRFWGKVDKSGDCWVWLAAKDQKGYGKFSMGPSHNSDGKRRNSMVSAHRVAYELTYGSISAGHGYHGTCVLHKCDNPSCVNPAHLFVGSIADNVHDMDKKGRRVNNQIRGGAHTNAILCESQVRDIVARVFLGETQTRLAMEYGVSVPTVNAIMVGRLWSHLGLVERKQK